MSDHYGRVGAFLEKHGKDVLVAFMPTSLEECLRRVEARRVGRGAAAAFNPANTQRRYDRIQKVHARIEADGKLRSMVLPEVKVAKYLVEELP